MLLKSQTLAVCAVCSILFPGKSLFMQKYVKHRETQSFGSRKNKTKKHLCLNPSISLFNLIILFHFQCCMTEEFKYVGNNNNN